MQKLVNHIQSTLSGCIITASDLEEFFILKPVMKGEVLLPIGSVCKHYYFVNQGVLRIFYFDENGDEHTSWVAFEGYFFTETESFARQTPSKYGIIATENTEILQIKKTDFDKLLHTQPWFSKYMTINQQETILNLIKTIELFQNQSVKDRYQALFEHPEFIKKVKQKDLASMLGMSKFSISRVKRGR